MSCSRAVVMAATLTVSLPLRLISAQNKPEPVSDPNTEQDPSAAASTGFIGKARLTLEVDNCGPEGNTDRRKLLKIAREHYERGEVLYVQGDYTGAVQELAASYCLVPFYSILKDLGQSYERQLDYQRAIAYLERYVAAVPADAKPLNDCAPDPQDEKKNVAARISVLTALPARITVTTNPPGADVVMTSDAGATARGLSGGKLIESRAGRYQMAISLDGYEPQTHEVEFEVGKPYGFYFNLQKQKGRINIVAIPDRARIQIADKVTGIGSTTAELTAGRYQVTVSAPDHKTSQQTFDVLPQREQRLVVKLDAIPQSGRTEIIVGLGSAGFVFGNGALRGYGGEASGVILGLTAGYLVMPSDIKLATSSLTISGFLAGAIAGRTGAGIFNFKEVNLGYSQALGTVAGAATGYFLGERLHPSPGRTALINSGVLWGSISGGLFAYLFNPSDRVNNGLVLTGMSVGLVSSALIGSSFRMSRRRVVLIDLAGVAGATLGLLSSSAAKEQVDGADTEANFALAGVVLGLLGGALLTRNVDALPSLPVTPVISPTSDGSGTLTFGVRGTM